MPAPPSPPPDPSGTADVDERAAHNRRNYYRVLHVQPEAPVEVIRASWRTLMGKLHPDLGGSHAQAALVNEAWDVLSDPARRTAYDAGLRGQTAAARVSDAVVPAATTATTAAGDTWGSAAFGARPTAAAAAWTAPPASAPPATRPRPARPEARAAAAWADAARGQGSGARVPVDATAPLTPAALPTRECPLCGHAAPIRLRADSRCTRCNAPLNALPGPGKMEHELFGRRDAVRRDQSHVATLHIGWPAQALPVRWRDLSLTGLSFYAAVPIAEGQRVHLIDSALEAVVEVVRCRPQGAMHVVHGRMVTALLLQAAGVFVSAQA